MAASRRSIVREHEFEEQLDALLCNAEEADDFINAAEYLLSEDPTIGERVHAGQPEIWKLASPPVRERAVALYYTTKTLSCSCTSSLGTERRRRQAQGGGSFSPERPPASGYAAASARRRRLGHRVLSLPKVNAPSERCSGKASRPSRAECRTGEAEVRHKRLGDWAIGRLNWAELNWAIGLRRDRQSKFNQTIQSDNSIAQSPNPGRLHKVSSRFIPAPASTRACSVSSG